MSDNIVPINPGKTGNFASPNHLTQVQNKGDKVDIVDHLDHFGVPTHLITNIDKDGNIRSELD